MADTIRFSELIAMVEVNVRSMTDTFLRNSWRNAFDMAMTAPDRETWRAIRDVYAVELDRRERLACEGPRCATWTCSTAH